MRLSGRRKTDLHLPSLRLRYLRSKAITSSTSPNIYRVFSAALEHNLCLDCAREEQFQGQIILATERKSMQNGSVIRAERLRGPDVWEFRWREPGADGKRKHRRMILGSIEQLADEAAARQAIATLRLDLNHGDAWLKTRSTTVSELTAHHRQRELEPDTIWKTHSTKVTYEGYLNKWILPRWGKYPLARVNAGEVELWLRSLPLAKSSCAKIRNLMSVLFNHGMRYEICNRNSIQLVRQSAKRKSVPVLLSANEVQRLLSVLGVRENTLVLLAFGTGLRMKRALWSQVARYRLSEQ